MASPRCRAVAGRTAGCTRRWRGARFRYQHDQVLVARLQLGEVVGVLKLAHHELGDEARQAVPATGKLVRVDHHGVGDGRCPAVAAVLLEEAPQEHPRQRLGRVGQRLWGEPGQVTFQQRPVDLLRLRGRGGAVGDEVRETFERGRAGTDRVERVAGRKSLPSPAYGCLSQPCLLDTGEGDRVPAAGGGHSQLSGMPGVGGVTLLQLLPRPRHRP